MDTMTWKILIRFFRLLKINTHEGANILMFFQWSIKNRIIAALHDFAVVRNIARDKASDYLISEALCWKDSLSFWIIIELLTIDL